MGPRDHLNPRPFFEPGGGPVLDWGPYYLTHAVQLFGSIESVMATGGIVRKEFEVFSFTEGVNTISDLKIGMRLPGIVTNVTNFGAFVDVGVHQDGLVHISHLADKFVKDPLEVVSVQQKVMVTVVEVDIARKRVGLSMKSDPFAQTEQQKPAASPKEKEKDKKWKPKGAHEKKKEKEKELTMEEKLAMLVNKFKK